jgi:hypothetical protein
MAADEDADGGVEGSDAPGGGARGGAVPRLGGWASAWLPASDAIANASGTKILHIEFSSHRNETKESDAFRQTINGKR